jgi:hypothetical protein
VTQPLTDAVEIPGQLITALRDANQEIKRLTETTTAIKALIKRAMGEREYATVDGEPAIRWAHVKSRRLDMDALRANVDPAILAGCYVDEVTRRFIPLTSKAKS